MNLHDLFEKSGKDTEIMVPLINDLINQLWADHDLVYHLMLQFNDLQKVTLILRGCANGMILVNRYGFPDFPPPEEEKKEFGIAALEGDFTLEDILGNVPKNKPPEPDEEDEEHDEG